VLTVVPNSCNDVSCCSCAIASSALLPMLLARMFNERCCKLPLQASATACTCSSCSADLKSRCRRFRVVRGCRAGASSKRSFPVPVPGFKERLWRLVKAPKPADAAAAAAAAAR
jgi:hypothetical protein